MVHASPLHPPAVCGVDPAWGQYRSRRTRIIGEPFYIYAARKWAGVNGHASAEIAPSQFTTGMIVGTAVVSKCVRENGHYCWHLADMKQLPNPRGRKPKGRPQPVRPQ